MWLQVGFGERLGAARQPARQIRRDAADGGALVKLTLRVRISGELAARATLLSKVLVGLRRPLPAGVGCADIEK